MKERFSVSHDELKGPGSSITFAEEENHGGWRWPSFGPGYTLSDKVVSLFEKMFGSARSQKVPCDASIPVA